MAKKRSLETTDKLLSIYDGTVIEDDQDSSVHYTALAEVQPEESDKVALLIHRVCLQ